MTKRDEQLQILTAVIASGKWSYPDDLVRQSVMIWEAFDKGRLRNDSPESFDDLLHKQEWFHLDKPVRVVDSLDDFGLEK